MVSKNNLQEWLAVRRPEDLIADATLHFHKLPAHALVPLMRSKADFPSDLDAIAIPPTPEEVESAECYVRGLCPKAY